MNKNENIETSQYTYHFFHSLERVWIILRDISIISLLTSSENYHPINTKGKNIFNEGSEFIGILLGKFPYHGKVLKVIEIHGYKKIKYEIQVQNGGYLMIKIELYKVTEDNTTILLITVKINKLLSEQTKNISEENFIKNFEKVDRELRESLTDLIQYESSVISASMQDIWDFSTNPNNLKKIAPLVQFDGFEDFIQPNIGDNIIINCNNNSKKIYIKVMLLDKKEKWNKWIYILQILGGEPKVPLQKVLLELTKINQTDCQIILLNKFDEIVDNDYIQKISEQKKYIINSIKDYLENYKN